MVTLNIEYSSTVCRPVNHTCNMFIGFTASYHALNIIYASFIDSGVQRGYLKYTLLLLKFYRLFCWACRLQLASIANQVLENHRVHLTPKIFSDQLKSQTL